jgi:sulfate-transporting ATPase
LGESFPAKDYRLGFLKQEPELNEDATVKENIMEGLGALNDWLKEFNELSEKMCDENITPDEMEKLIERQGTIQEKIEAVDGWEVDQKLDQAMDALRCPPADSPVTNLSGGRGAELH